MKRAFIFQFYNCRNKPFRKEIFYETSIELAVKRAEALMLQHKHGNQNVYCDFSYRKWSTVLFRLFGLKQPDTLQQEYFF